MSCLMASVLLRRGAYSVTTGDCLETVVSVCKYVNDSGITGGGRRGARMMRMLKEASRPDAE